MTASNDAALRLNPCRFHASIPHVHDLQGRTKRGVAGDAAGGVKGESLTPTPSLSVTHSEIDRAADPALADRVAAGGHPSHVRYVERAEKEQLTAVQAALGRPEAKLRGADPDQEIRGVVGADPGRAAQDL